MGEEKEADGSLRSGFLKVKPQISCIKVHDEVVVGASLTIQIPGVTPAPKKS